MPSVPTDENLENERLATKYRPLLVLYPEIEDGSRRKDHHRRGHRPGSPPPLDQDYHPRDIRLVLDHACLPGRKERPSREQVSGQFASQKHFFVRLYGTLPINANPSCVQFGTTRTHYLEARLCIAADGGPLAKSSVLDCYTN